MTASSPPMDDDAPHPVPIRALRAHALEGGAVVLAFDLADDPACIDHPLLDALPEGQRRVVYLALQGCSDLEIAERLGRSRHTVANQLRRAYRRLGVNGRAELAARVRPTSEPPSRDTHPRGQTRRR